MAANARQRHSQVTRLKNESGDWVDKSLGLSDLVRNYFTDIFASQGFDPHLFLQGIEHRVTESQNEQLLVPFTELDVKEPLFSMHSDKAPGLDGMNPAFFQKHWSVVKDMSPKHVSKSWRKVSYLNFFMIQWWFSFQKRKLLRNSQIYDQLPCAMWSIVLLQKCWRID